MLRKEAFQIHQEDGTGLCEMGVVGMGVTPRPVARGCQVSPARGCLIGIGMRWPAQHLPATLSDKHLYGCWDVGARRSGARLHHHSSCRTPIRYPRWGAGRARQLTRRHFVIGQGLIGHTLRRRKRWEPRPTPRRAPTRDARTPGVGGRHASGAGAWTISLSARGCGWRGPRRR